MRTTASFKTAFFQKKHLREELKIELNRLWPTVQHKKKKDFNFNRNFLQKHKLWMKLSAKRIYYIHTFQLNFLKQGSLVGSSLCPLDFAKIQKFEQ